MLISNSFGLSKGVIVDTEDPAGWHRVRVRIPSLHGTFDEEFYSNLDPNVAKVNRIEDKYLPWAEVCFPFGQEFTPEVNQVVLVGFLDGSTDQPVVLGWMGYEYNPEEEKMQVKHLR